MTSVPSGGPVDSPLWQFAVALYEQPGVPEATLALQDGDGVNVAFVLACFWLAQRGVSVEAARVPLGRALGEVAVLHGQALTPLREARRALKPMIAGWPPSAREVAARLRKRLVREELALEQLEHWLIHRALWDLQSGDTKVDARALFDAYLEAAGIVLSRAGEEAFLTLMKSVG